MTYPIIDAKATGRRIRELRMEHHLKVEDVAEFMGFVSEQAVYKWQRGDSLPTIDNLYALSRLFGTTVDDIIMGNRGEDESPLLPECDSYTITYTTGLFLFFRSGVSILSANGF